MLSSKTNALLTHTLASFWREQSCVIMFCIVLCNLLESVLLDRLSNEPEPSNYYDVIMNAMAYQITSASIV